MNLITFSGPPSSGKTSVILKTIQALKESDLNVGVVKFDCLSTEDDLLYEKAGIRVKKGLSGGLCPDHFFVSNIEEVVKWGIDNKFDVLILSLTVEREKVLQTQAVQGKEDFYLFDFFA